MQKTLKILRYIFSIATVGMVLILCWQCLDIYLTGNQAENINAGVYLSPVYSVEIVSERLAAIRPLAVVYAVIALVAIVAQIGWGKVSRTKVKIRPYHPSTQPGKTVNIARVAILCLGVLFIILGVMNGGARDVLVKAINICTECIGLG